MASPAEIANDMAASAALWEHRDKRIARTCRDAARMIRAHLAGDPVDGRTWGGLHTRLLDLSGKTPYGDSRIQDSLGRALQTLYVLRAEASR